MSLQNKKKEYIKAIGIEGWNINHKTIHIRYYLWSKKAGRVSKEFEPDRNKCVTDVPIPETFEPVGTDTIDIMKQLMYLALDGYQDKKTLDYPYRDMLDC